MYNFSTVGSVSVEVGNKIKFEFSKKKLEISAETISVSC